MFSMNDNQIKMVMIHWTTSHYAGYQTNGKPTTADTYFINEWLLPWPRPPTVSTHIYQKYPQIQTLISAKQSTFLHLHRATTSQSVLKTKS